MSKTWALLERFDVPHFDRPEESYLSRLRIVATPWFGIYLHRIGTPDSRPVLYDHPWSFLSLVLWGSYSEVAPLGALHGQPYGRKRRRVRWANWKRAEDFHYIAELHRRAVWTLVLTGPRASAGGSSSTSIRSWRLSLIGRWRSGSACAVGVRLEPLHPQPRARGDGARSRSRLGSCSAGICTLSPDAPYTAGCINQGT